MGEPIDITATNATLRVAHHGGAGCCLVVEVGGRDLVAISGSWRDLMGLVGGASDRLSQLLMDFPELRSASGPGPAGLLAMGRGRGHLPPTGDTVAEIAGQVAGPPDQHPASRRPRPVRATRPAPAQPAAG